MSDISSIGNLIIAIVVVGFIIFLAWVLIKPSFVICDKCGKKAKTDMKKKLYECKHCGNSKFIKGFS